MLYMGVKPDLSLLREYHILRIAANGVLAKSLRPTGEEKTEGWRKWHDDNGRYHLHTRDHEGNKIKSNETGKSYENYGGQKKCSKNLFGKHEGKRSLGIP
jgi:hypothetical protein